MEDNEQIERREYHPTQMGPWKQWRAVLTATAIGVFFAWLGAGHPGLWDDPYPAWMRRILDQSTQARPAPSPSRETAR